MLGKLIETSVAYINQIENKIIVILFKKECNIHLSDVQEIVEAINAMNPENNQRLIYYDSSISFEFDALQAIAQSQRPNAVAVVYKDDRSLPILKSTQQMFSNLKCRYELKLFESDKEAKLWLQKVNYT